MTRGTGLGTRDGELTSPVDVFFNQFSREG